MTVFTGIPVREIVLVYQVQIEVAENGHLRNHVCFSIQWNLSGMSTLNVKKKWSPERLSSQMCSVWMEVWIFYEFENDHSRQDDPCKWVFPDRFHCTQIQSGKLRHSNILQYAVNCLQNVQGMEARIDGVENLTSSRCPRNHNQRLLVATSSTNYP